MTYNEKYRVSRFPAALKSVVNMIEMCSFFIPTAEIHAIFYYAQTRNNYQWIAPNFAILRSTDPSKG
jgi:hypothetical protein